jgi:hypothetical protein
MCNNFIFNANYTSKMENVAIIAIMFWASFYKTFMGINVTKWSWANYYKNAYVNKVSKISLLY